MSRYIDADALLMELDMTEDLSAYDAVVFEEMVNEQPTADVVEVVRCEDCRYWDNRFDVMVCNLTDGMKGASDFCSYGERREE